VHLQRTAKAKQNKKSSRNKLEKKKELVHNQIRQVVRFTNHRIHLKFLKSKREATTSTTTKKKEELRI
jgi:hypothetical protein